MLIDYDVLKRLETTNDAIKALFTAEPGSALHEKRKEWEKRIESRIQEGALWGLKNHQFYQAADLAWDSNIITKELVPLSLYAQGKIQFAQLKDALKDVPAETRDRFLKKDEKTGQPIGVDIPAFHKVVVNLVRSLITKRVATISTRYTKQYPFFAYEALGTTQVSKLRSDVLSQRIEMMANQYDYRHDLTQSIRDMLLYSFSVEFPRSAWDRERSIRKKKMAKGFTPAKEDDWPIETFVTREGLSYKRPHPSRFFYDMAYPPSSINTDTGCTFVGHWNVVPYRDVYNNPKFFNRSTVEFDSSFASKLVGYRNYWALYFPTSSINFPEPGNGGVLDVVGANEREKQTGLYSVEDKDRTVLLTEYFERVIPKDVGLGKYPFPVWVRLVVAADRTVVYGEIMPCVPAVYMGYNCSDGKILNNAFAHEAMPWQDQMSNMFTNLLLAQKSALVKMLLLDIDQIKDPELLKQIRKLINGEDIYMRPLLLEYNGSVAADMGQKPREVLGMSEATALGDPTLFFRSILQVLALAERVLGTSANENAQSEPREVSATESANIAGSVNTSISFMSQGVDEAITAKKRQLYEAFMACGETRITVPAANRYLDSTIKAAGFEPYNEAEEGETVQENYAADDPRRVTLLGTKTALVYDYNFASRDGSERPINAKAAEVLVQLLTPLAQLPGVIQAMGQETFYSYLNTIVRLSGAGVDIKFERKDGQTDEVPTGDPVADSQAAVQSAIQKIIEAIEQDRAQLQRIEQRIDSMSGGMPSMPAA
jgi:hypothetical protein